MWIADHIHMAAAQARPILQACAERTTLQPSTPSLQGRFSLEGLRAAGPEAASLVAAMLAQASGARPPMAAVLAHPAWWHPAQKLAFLVDLSNAMEFQDRAVSVAGFSDVWQGAGYRAKGFSDSWRQRPACTSGWICAML
jgi:hypothetical protein